MVKLTFVSSSPLIKTDVSSIVYQGDPLEPLFKTVPVNIVFQLPVDPRLIAKFPRHLDSFFSSGGKLDSITLDTLSTFQNTLTSKRVLKSTIQKLREIVSESTPILLDLASKTWQTEGGLRYLHSLNVVLSTTYLENHLIMPGWAGNRESKRLPYPLLHFSPKIGGGIHLVLSGSLGPGMGSYDIQLPKPYDSTNLLLEITSLVFEAVRYYSLTRVWIEFQNTDGRMDYPLPASPLIFPELDVNILVIPFTNKNKMKCCSNDQVKIKEEWDRLVGIMDGLAY